MQLLCLLWCQAWRRFGSPAYRRGARGAQVKRKMTAEEFVHNNRGINAGASLPPEFLRALYVSIVARPIRMPASGCLAHAREERNGGPGAPFALPRLLSRCGALSCPLQACSPLSPVPTSLRRAWVMHAPASGRLVHAPGRGAARPGCGACALRRLLSCSVGLTLLQISVLAHM